MQREFMQFKGDKLSPYIRPNDARTQACVMLAAVATFKKGDRLAQITTADATLGKWTKANLTKITAPSGAPTLGATGADGTLAAGVYALAYTYVNANGETTISPVGTVTVGATNHITVAALTPLPTGVTSVNLYITDAGGHDFHLAANYDGAARSILAPVNSNQDAPTSNTAYLKSDGSQTPRRLCVRDFVTDANGLVYEGIEPATEGVLSSQDDTAMGYDKGYFLLSDLTNAITDDEIAALGAQKLGVGDQAHIYIP